MDTDKTLQLRILMGVEGKEEAQKATDLLQDTGKATEHVAGGGRELHRVIAELNQIVPGLGEALKVAFKPEEMGIVGALVAFEALKSVLEDLRATNEIKLANFTGDKEAIEAVRDAYEKAAVAAQLFNEEQLRQNSEGMSAEDIAQRQIENFKNLVSAQEQYNAAQKKFGDAEVDDREKKGVITHQQALEEKFALDVEYTTKKLQLEARTDAEEVAAKERQLAAEKQLLAATEIVQKTDEANAAAADAAKVKHDKRKDEAQKNIEDAQKTLEELGKSHGNIIEGKIDEETVQQLKEYFEKYVGGDSGKVNLSDQFLQLQEKMKTITNPASWDFGLTNFLDRTIGSQEGPASLEKYQGAKNQILDAERELKALDETQFKVDLNAERGKKQLETTDGEISKLAKSVADLTRTIPQLKADNAAKLNNNAGVENLNLRAEAVGKGLTDPGNTFLATSQPVGTSSQPFVVTGTRAAPEPSSGQSEHVVVDQIARKDWGQLDKAGQILGGGGQLDKQQTALLQEILKGATGHTIRYDKILETIQQINANQASRDAAFEQLRQQVSNSRNRISG